MSLEVLFEGVELSEEAKAQAKVIFESAVEEQVNAAKEEFTKSLQEEFDEKVQVRMTELDEAAKRYQEEELVPTINTYLTAAVNEWVEENKPTIQADQKVKLAEAFLTGLTGLAAEHQLVLPEGKDQLEVMQKQVDDLTEKSNAYVETNVQLQKENIDLKRAKVFEDVTKSLSENQKDKLVVPFDKTEFKSVEQITEALKGLVEAYFPADSNKEEIKEEKVKIDESAPKTLTAFDAYVKALSERTIS